MTWYPGNHNEALMGRSELVSNSNNNFVDNDKVNSVDAYVNMGKSYDYYKNKLSRNSIDNKGMDVKGFVHVAKIMVTPFGMENTIVCSLAMVTDYTSLLLLKL